LFIDHGNHRKTPGWTITVTNNPRKVLSGLKAVLPACMVVFPLLVSAQEYNDPGILQNPYLSKPLNFQAQGARLGGFMLFPGMDLVYEDHDNIYYQNENARSDTVYHVRPRVNLTSGWSRHSLQLNAMGDFARFEDAGQEDYDDLSLSMNARIDVKRGKNFTVQAATAFLHEDRSSPEDREGIEPTEFSNNSLGFGYHHVFNRLTANLSWNRNTTDYDNNLDAAGEIIDNRDRDQHRDSVRLKLDYQVMPQRSVFLSLATNSVEYDLPSDAEGFVRESDGFQVRGGMNFDITGVLSGSLWLQYLDQDYDDQRFTGQNDTGFGAALEWSPTRLTNFSLRADRSLLETTQPDSSGYINTLYSLRVQHELRRYLLVHARVSYSDNDYDLTPQAPESALATSDVRRTEIGLSYLINPSVQLTAGYSRSKQDASVVWEQYEASRFFLTLGLEL
jgi:hypothetical protein